LTTRVFASKIIVAREAASYFGHCGMCSSALGQVPVRQPKRRVLECGRNDHRHVARFGRGRRIERMMGQVLAVQHRRETAGHLGLGFEQLLPWHALDIGDAVARDPKLR
jgi:hypothetical protein